MAINDRDSIHDGDSSLLIIKISDLQISKFQNPKVRYTGLFENFEILRFSDLKNPYFLRMFPYFSLYFLK